jgi:hypothetical protein
MDQRLTKKVVARRQLATAIRLHFANGDAVSVYSLAANAWEIIDVLCQKAGVESLSMQARENIPANVDLKRKYINSPHRNFFKHADSDFDKELDPIPEAQVDAVLFLAVEDYIRLAKKSPVEFQVFQIWYLAAHPEKVVKTALDDVIAVAAGYFPNLNSMTRSQKLAIGAQVLAKAEGDNELQSDSRTESAFG